MLKVEPKNAYTHWALRRNLARWLQTFATSTQYNSPDGNALKPPAFLTPVIHESLKIPISDHLSASQATEIASVARRLAFNRKGKNSSAGLVSDQDILAELFTTIPVVDESLDATPSYSLLQLLVLATKQHPEPYNLNTLAVVYYRLGQYTEAVATLNDFISRNVEKKETPNALDLAFLSLSHLAMGELELASRFRTQFNDRLDAISAEKWDSDWKIIKQEIDETFAKADEKKGEAN